LTKGRGDRVHRTRYSSVANPRLWRADREPARFENKDGLLRATELARYVDRRVRNLTAGGQSSTMEIHFDGTLFALP
jgi:hypothetical protein